MADHGRVHPGCANASNPYHECGVACLEKIGPGGQGKGPPERKKSDNYKGFREGGAVKKTDGERRVDGTCPKASNPYHNCDEFCPNRAVKSFNTPRNKKESDSFVKSRPRSPRVVNDDRAVKSAYTAETPSPINDKKKTESGNSLPFISQNSREIVPADNSSGNGQIQSLGALLNSEKAMHETPKDSPPTGSFTRFAVNKIAKPEEDQSRKIDVSPKAISNHDNKVGRTTSGPHYGPLDFVFSPVSRATEISDDEEDVQSVISESCVSVGKYHVRAHNASILQQILDKYGDIAANCRLESTSMRSYYLECLCTVIHDLRSTPFQQLTKSRIKEMLAVIKDAESVLINLTWFGNILDKLTEGMKLKTQHQAAEEEKAKHDHEVDATRKELEAMTEDVALKEKEIAELNLRIDEARDRLSKLELETSKLSESILSTSSKVEKFRMNSLVDRIL